MLPLLHIVFVRRRSWGALTLRLKALKALGLLSCNTPRFPDRDGNSKGMNLMVWVTKKKQYVVNETRDAKDTQQRSK